MSACDLTAPTTASAVALKISTNGMVMAARIAGATLCIVFVAKISTSAPPTSVNTSSPRKLTRNHKKWHGLLVYLPSPAAAFPSSSPASSHLSSVCSVAISWKSTERMMQSAE